MSSYSIYLWCLTSLCRVNCCCPSPAQSLLFPCRSRITTIFFYITTLGVVDFCAIFNVPPINPVYIGCSFCRLITRREHLIGRHWYLPANWKLFIRWSLDQWVSQCYTIYCLCSVSSWLVWVYIHQPVRWTPYTSVTGAIPASTWIDWWPRNPLG
jgi:hypothetical protein